MSDEAIALAEAGRISAMTGDPDGWRLWGPYLSERAWGTVREDYSVSGDAWGYFPHDHARSRAFRWSDDGLGGISDIRQFLCFAPAFWNGADPILKERLFGLGNPEGNHGEDVKEVYFHADATPSQSYLKFLYRYPQREFPYAALVSECRRRKSDLSLPEYELVDTGIFDENRFFDIEIEYAKVGPDDLSIRIVARNRGPETASLVVLPTLWFRNTWSWKAGTERPELRADGDGAIVASHERLGTYRLEISGGDGERWFTENETNNERLFQSANMSPFVKDAFHRRLIGGETGATNPENFGTKAAFVRRLEIPAGDARTIWLRLSRASGGAGFEGGEEIFARRIAEADAFYAKQAPDGTPDALRKVQREAFAGLIWNKQFYHYDIERWHKGDPALPPPPDGRTRNDAWESFTASDILSMPDKWEYPWFAAWDTAFHCIPLARIDPDFAKHQLILLCREWYMHMNGQLPAYEWNFSDVNPPVHAMAALRVYKIERAAQGKSRSDRGDTDFLERIFHKLLINFTWWVNRVDALGNNLFEGGFLGLDNIGIFDRSAPLPTGGILEQCDGTAWMAMYSLNMLAIALELARFDTAYQDVATKFAEHFLHIAHALNGSGVLWDDTDGFYYDALRLPSGDVSRLPVRSIAGLIPLFAVEVFDAAQLNAVPDFRQRLQWLVENKPELCDDVAYLGEPGQADRLIFALVGFERAQKILGKVLDENEFLSPFGIRSLSKFHEKNPFSLEVDGRRYSIAYDPGDSTTGMFGGNSNWRGPIWFPLNVLLIESLQKYAFALGDDYRIEAPTGSGVWKDLWDVAADLSERNIALFVPSSNTHARPFSGWRGDNLADPTLFHEFFHADTGEGLGASHQCGWTALVAHLVARRGG